MTALHGTPGRAPPDVQFIVIIIQKWAPAGALLRLTFLCLSSIT
jgi:hypothetical protein